MAVSSTTDLTTALEDLTVGSTEKQVNYRGSSELGKEEFLKLLVCQLQNQDPLNPQSDTEFISQLAQFSSLEQMTNMNATLTNTSAYSLVGKEVIVQTTDSTGAISEVRGTVDYVEMQNGDAMLSIDGKTYSVDDLIQVMDTAYAAQAYLPSVEEQTQVFDQSNPGMISIKLDLGSNGYEASSVAVAINGTYIDKEYMSFDDGELMISPEAFKDLEPGSYYLGLYFDDPYATSITDKVTIKVVNSGIDLGGSETEDAGTDEEVTDETEDSGTEDTQNA